MSYTLQGIVTMNNMCSAMVLCFLILNCPVAYGQSQSNERGRNLSLRPEFVAEKVADLVITPRGSKWLVLRQDAQIPPRAIFEEHRDDFYLGENDRMDIVREDEDDLGFTHYRYQQTYQGIKVEGEEMAVHAPRLFIGDNNDEP